ncbi:MAG: alpha/beta hydrolase fold domain-containing protein [Alphaproteobacteria bacterium]|nr:alpha/beta hydrolase fold domain-containing protein [Alphaproteobacteria bacterium]
MSGANELDPEIAAADTLDLERFGPAPVHLPGNPAAARAEQERRRAPWNVGGPVMAQTRDMTLDFVGRSVAARLYVPEGAGDGLVLYLHGGGWVIGSLATHDRLTRMLAHMSGLRFLGLGYRKAPEHPYPAAIEDALDAWDWMHAHAAELGARRFAVAGDSAGANIAAAMTMTLCGGSGRPIPDAFASLYGVFDSNLDSVSYLMRGDGRYGLSRASMATFWELYCPDAAQRRGFSLSPARAPEGYLAALKHPLLIAAGLDPLRDDSRRMRDVLIAAGVETAYVEYPRANHGFCHLSSVSASARAALAQTADHLKRSLAGN